MYKYKKLIRRILNQYKKIVNNSIFKTTIYLFKITFSKKVNIILFC